MASFTHPATQRISRGDIAALAVLVVLVLFLFRDAAFAGRFFYERDIHILWHPQAEAFARVVRAGSPPLWNPLSSFGAPLLATPNAQVLYPPTWLLLVVRPWTYYTLYVLFHAFLFGCGLYAVARRLGASRAGSLVGALIGMSSGPFLSLVPLWNHLAGAAWMPWVVLAGDHALSSRRAAEVVSWGLALAVTVLAGSPELGLLAAVASVVLGLRHAGWPPSGQGLRRLGVVAALAALVAIAVAAAQWIPSVELARRSNRADLSESVRDLWSLHPAHLAEIVLPVRFEDLPLQPHVRGALYASRQAYLRSLYLGIPVLILALAAGAGRRDFATRALAILAVLGVVAALGAHTPAYGAILAVAPPLKALRYPIKALILVVFAGSLLAALGYDAWRQGPHTWGVGLRRTLMGLLITGLAAMGLLAAAASITPDAFRAILALPPEGARGVLGPASLSLGIGIASSALMAFALIGRRAPAVAATLAACVAVGDLIVAAHGLNPTVPERFFTEEPEVVKHVRVADGSRLYVVDYSVPGMSEKLLGHGAYALPPGIRSAEGALSWALRRYLHPPQYAAWGLEGSYEPDGMAFQPRYLDALNHLLWFFQGSPEQVRMLQIGAVSRAVSLHAQGFESTVRLAAVEGVMAEPIQVFQIPDPVPRAYAVSGVRTPRDHRAIAESLLAFDPRREVLLTEGADPRSVSPSFVGECRILSRLPHRLRVEANLSEEGYVVLIDTYDPDWQASIDGVPARLLRANVAFRAIPTPAGRHTIELVYRPSSVRIGLTVSVLAVAALAAALALAAVRERSSRRRGRS